MEHYDEAQLAAALTLDDAMQGLRRAFLEHAEGRVRVQSRVPTDYEGFRLNTMAAILPGLGRCGAKVYTAHRGRFAFLVLLFAMDDGRLLATFDAGGLTKLRTAAVTLLAAERLARPDSETLVVFGTGTQAEGHLEAFVARYPIRRVSVVGRAGAPAFAARAAARLRLPVTVSSAEEALPRADIVVTATRSAVPLFEGRLVPPGCFVAAVGSARPDAAEIDATLLARSDRIVVESVEHAHHEAGDLLVAQRHGVDVWPRLVELGALLAQHAPGRERDDEITLFESLGFAIEDVAIASVAYDKLATARRGPPPTSRTT